MGIAAHVAAWEQLPGGWVSPPLAYGLNDATHPIVELYLGEQWVDVTSYVYYRDMITITRGRSSEASQTDPGSCRFTINNRDGRFSPRNPVGPYYEQIGRNTPVRVSIIRNGERRYRFYGEVSSWPVQWDISGSDVWVEIEAAGILRRLGQGTSPLFSPMRREFSSPTRASIVAYWPFEDSTGSTTIASGLSGHPTMTFSGTPTLSTFSDWPGSSALPTMGSAIFTGNVPTYTHTGEFSLRMFMDVPAAGVSITETIVELTTLGTARRWTIQINSSGNLALKAFDADGATVLDTGFLTFGVNDDRFALVLELEQDGADVDYRLLVEDYTNAELIGDNVPTTQSTGTLAGYTIDRVSRIRLNTGGGLDDVSIGHVALADDLAAYSATSSAILGWRGETPFDRMERLCQEEGINFKAISTERSGNTVTMGVQGTDTILNLLHECAEVDFSHLVETTDAFGLGMRPRTTLYNQSAALTLDYAQNELAAALDPVDDDRYTANDVTVSRPSGSSYRDEEDEGPLSVAEPPDGVGRYSTSVTANVADDTQLVDQVGWRLHLGTTDEARYPKIRLNLRHSTFTDSIAMMNAILTLRVGDRVVVENLPAWLPPDDITQLVEGFTETLGVLEHDIELTCSPESPYHICFLDNNSIDSDGLGKEDTSGSELTLDVTSSETEFRVITTDGPIWVETADNPDELPFNAKLGGEVVTVTDIDPLAQDVFTRTETNTWGTSTSGHTWVEEGGSASDRSVNGSVGVITLASSPATIRLQTLSSSIGDCDIRVSISPDQLATGDAFLPSVVMRYANSGNYYRVRAHLNTDGTVQLALLRVTTQVGSTASTGLTYSAGSTLWLYVRIRGQRVQAHVGPASPTGEEAWQLDETFTSDTIAAGAVGVSGSAFSGNTNVSPAFSYDDFEVVTPQLFTVTRSANGVSKPHLAGASISHATPVFIVL